MVDGTITETLHDESFRQEQLCDELDRCHHVSTYLLDRAPAWLDEL